MPAHDRLSLIPPNLLFSFPEENEPNVGDLNTSADFHAAATTLQESTSAIGNMSLLKKMEAQQNTIKRLQLTLAKERRLKRKLLHQKNTLDQKLSKVFSTHQLSQLSRVSTRGVEWSKETVKKALQLRFACGAAGYELLLSQGQPLPSMRSLRRRMEVVSMEPGILSEVFELLKLKVTALNTKERECCLTLDEMSLRVGLQFDRSSGCLRGDVTLPGHSGGANHALVVMLGGVTTRWKQIVAYHFTGDSVNGTSLKPFILEIIRQAHEIGLHVNSITSDMGSANQSLWKSFGVVVSRFSRTVNKIKHPFADGRWLYFIADAPHVIKNLKSCLINGNVITLSSAIVNKYKLPSCTVTVDHVKALAAFQADKDLKLAPKLTNVILNPGHFGKMKVSHALNFFSHSISSALRYLVECEGYDKSHLTTAWFLDFVNKWFDLMSSRHPVMALSKCNQDAWVYFKTPVLVSDGNDDFHFSSSYYYNR